MTFEEMKANNCYNGDNYDCIYHNHSQIVSGKDEIWINAEGPKDDEQALYRANIDEKMYYQCQK